jgi:hypothetical protein
VQAAAKDRGAALKLWRASERFVELGELGELGEHPEDAGCKLPEPQER